MRPLIPLVVGLAVGIAGAVLFLQSMPPKEGSAEERLAKMEVDLKKANNRVAALEAADPNGRRKPGRTLADGARGIAENFRDGKPVTPDDLFHAFQPFMRDFSACVAEHRDDIAQCQMYSDSFTACQQQARLH